jgi:archaeal type IV pilus assembly protein PilA
MNIGKEIRKFRKNMRAISPVIATLLMIAIAVVASLVTYAWVMGYMNFTTTKTGHAIEIQSTYVNTTALYVYVQNAGSGQVTLSTVYVNGTLTAFTQVTPTTSYLDEGSTASLKVGAANQFNANDKLDIKVTTADGTFMQITRNP